jgi:hypothetical protein
MTRKTYRTAQGKTVDLGALQLQNETVRAVGNMSVNARGDLIDGWNRPIDTRNKQVSRQYNRQTTNVTDTPVNNTPPKAQKVKKTKEKAPAVSVPTPPEDFQDDFEKPAQQPAQPAQPAGGLAAAIARSRQIRQELVQSPDQQKPGLTRI